MGPWTEEEYSYLHAAEKMKPTLLAISLGNTSSLPRESSFPNSCPSTSLSPSFSTVEMVCEVLLGDVQVLEWLLITGFEGAFPCPAMKQVA